MEWCLRTSDFSLNESRLLLKYAFRAFNKQTTKKHSNQNANYCNRFTRAHLSWPPLLIHFLTSIKCRKLRKSKAEHKFSMQSVLEIQNDHRQKKTEEKKWFAQRLEFEIFCWGEKEVQLHISWWCLFVLKYLRIVQHNWTSCTGKSDYLIKTKWEKKTVQNTIGGQMSIVLIWKLYLNMFMHIVVNSTAIIVRKRGRLAKIFHRQFTLWTNIAEKKSASCWLFTFFSEAAYIQPNQHNNNSAIQHGLLR